MNPFAMIAEWLRNWREHRICRTLALSVILPCVVFVLAAQHLIHLWKVLDYDWRVLLSWVRNGEARGSLWESDEFPW